MNRTHSLSIVAGGAALVALGWLAWRSGTSAPAPVALEDAAALAAPSVEKLAALDSAEARAAPPIESQTAPAREAVEVRTIQTRSASITVQPPKVESENRGMIIVWCYLESSHASIDPEELVLLAPDGRELRGTDEKQKGTFRGLVSGSYSVLVRDSRFENVRIDSVTTGSHVLIDLMGTARVRPHATDAATGETIATSTLRLVDFGREKEFPPDAEGWFTGLPGGDLDLRISAPGYEESRLVAQGLLPGESREVELRFSRSGEIRGVVVSEATGAPAPNVFIRLDWSGAQEMLAELRARAGVRFSMGGSARSDAEGRFTIKDLRFGEYKVIASQGSLLESVAQSVVLATGDCVKEVVLRVPAGCSLSGTLTCGTADAVHAGLGNFRVLVQLLGAPDQARLDHAMALVQPDGRFRFADAIPIERVRVLLAMRPQGPGYDSGPESPGSRVLGELALHAGENECSFDVSELLPGFAQVEVVASGFEIDDGALLVAAREGGSEIESYELRRGWGRIGPLPPGDYWVLARGDGDEWLSATPAALHIERNETTELRLELKLVRGELVVQDKEGAVLGAGTQVGVWCAGSSWSGPRVAIRPRVGEDGELALALEPGSYRVGMMRTETSLEWTAAGPVPAVLRLPLSR